MKFKSAFKIFISILSRLLSSRCRMIFQSFRNRKLSMRALFPLIALQSSFGMVGLPKEEQEEELPLKNLMVLSNTARVKMIQLTQSTTASSGRESLSIQALNSSTYLLMKTKAGRLSSRTKVCTRFPSHSLCHLTYTNRLFKCG